MQLTPSCFAFEPRVSSTSIIVRYATERLVGLVVVGKDWIRLKWIKEKVEVPGMQMDVGGFICAVQQAHTTVQVTSQSLKHEVK